MQGVKLLLWYLGSDFLAENPDAAWLAVLANIQNKLPLELPSVRVGLNLVRRVRAIVLYGQT